MIKEYIIPFLASQLGYSIGRGVDDGSVRDARTKPPSPLSRIIEKKDIQRKPTPLLVFVGVLYRYIRPLCLARFVRGACPDEFQDFGVGP